MFAINESSYLSIVWNCWVTMLEIRETDDPVIPMCEATQHNQRLENTHQLCAHYPLKLDCFLT